MLSYKGWSVDFFAWTFVWMTIISISVGLLAGIAIDRTSARAMLPGLLVPMGLGCFVLALMDSQMALVVFMSLLGVSMGVVSANIRVSVA